MLCSDVVTTLKAETDFFFSRSHVLRKLKKSLFITYRNCVNMLACCVTIERRKTLSLTTLTQPWPLKTIFFVDSFSLVTKTRSRLLKRKEKNFRRNFNYFVAYSPPTPPSHHLSIAPSLFTVNTKIYTRHSLICNLSENLNWYHSNDGVRNIFKCLNIHDSVAYGTTENCYCNNKEKYR